MYTETNKLIAEFMGYELEMSIICYHTSWEWIMAVVDKIESIPLPKNNYPVVTIGPTYFCTIKDAYGKLFEINGHYDTKLLSTYDAVVGFIKWYDKNK